MLNQSLRLNWTRSAVVRFYSPQRTSPALKKHKNDSNSLSLRMERDTREEVWINKTKQKQWASNSSVDLDLSFSDVYSTACKHGAVFSVPVGLLSSQELETFHPGTSQSEPEATVWKANWTLCYSLSRAVLSAHYFTPVPVKSRWLGFHFEPSSLNRSLELPLSFHLHSGFYK